MTLLGMAIRQGINKMAIRLAQEGVLSQGLTMVDFFNENGSLAVDNPLLDTAIRATTISEGIVSMEEL